ncbi:Zinc/iron permease [Mucor lusitanicus]
MEPFTWLLLLSIAMLVGSYVAGSLPLTTKLSDRKIRILNALGAGLLIGTSLMVVIPEGVETIYSSRATSSLVNSNSLPKSHYAKIPNLSTLDTTNKNWAASHGQEEEEGDIMYKIVTKRAPTAEEEKEEGKEHVAVGLSLIIGFALMFIIDQVSSLHMTAPNTNGIEYSELDTTHTTPVNQPSMTPTVGLVVHAAADGIALGASASHPQLSMVVFIAIMLHKAPASFALTSVLLAGGLSHATIRKHLLLFALAAPSGALFTYFALYFFSSSSTSASTLEYWTGVLLVFSGGTFSSESKHHHGNGQQQHQQKADQSQLFIIVVGMVIPIFLSMTHSH